MNKAFFSIWERPNVRWFAGGVSGRGEVTRDGPDRTEQVLLNFDFMSLHKVIQECAAIKCTSRLQHGRSCSPDLARFQERRREIRFS